MTEKNETTGKKASKDTLYTVQGKVLETSDVIKGEKVAYTKSTIETSKGRKLTVMAFGKVVETMGSVIKAGADVKLRGRYSQGTKGGVSFVALFVPEAKVAA